MDTAAYLFPGMKEWLLVLPAKPRLYTSVIPLDPEISALKESWATDMSPTALYLASACPCGSVPGSELGGRVYPGSGTGWVPEGCYTGYPARPSQTPIFSIF